MTASRLASVGMILVVTSVPYAGGPNTGLLKGIAARTGDVAELFRDAIDGFRQSYLLSYTPTDANAAGGTRLPCP
jgi:hypothetical protein